MEEEAMNCFVNFCVKDDSRKRALEDRLRIIWNGRKATESLWVLDVPDNSTLISGGLKSDLLNVLDGTSDTLFIAFCLGACNFSGSKPSGESSEVL
jgi:hypothetical protein